MAYTAATKNASAEILEERLQLFEYNVALNVHYTLLDYTPCSDDWYRVGASIGQLARLGAWIALVVTCQTEHRQNVKGEDAIDRRPTSISMYLTRLRPSDE